MQALIEDIKIITLFALAFFSIFLFTYRKGNRKVNILLGLIYLFQALEALNSAFYRFFDFWSVEYPWVFYTTELTFFLWGPTIMYFFKLAVEPDYKLSKVDLVHAVPAIVHAGFLMVRFHFHSNADKTLMLNNGAMSPVEDFVIHSLKNAFVVAYLILSTLEVRRMVLGKRSKSWLLFFLVAFFLVEAIQILHFYDLFTRTYNTQIYNATSFIWCVIAVATIYKVLQNPFILHDQEDSQKLSGNTSKGQSVENLDEELGPLVDKIKSEFIGDEMFLDPELNLQSASVRMGVHSKKLSKVINEHFDMSFSDFVSFYRIEEAKKRLSNSQLDNKTVIEIAYEVGFNSKATFNRAFSKFTNLSPTQFRKAHQ